MLKQVNNELMKVAGEMATFTNVKDKIGLLQEHTLHRTLKFYYSLDETNHEIKVGSMFADCIVGGVIYEIQTKNLNLLRDKLKEFLKDHKVCVVYPLSQNKICSLYDKDGNLIRSKKSPKHDNIYSFIKELYKIKSFLKNDNLSFDVLFLDILEEREEVEKTYRRRKGYERINQIVQGINSCVHLESKDDYIELLNSLNLPSEFTSDDFHKCAHILKGYASTILNVLNEIDVVERIGKSGNSYIYRIKK